ncbi:DUF4435 domain-containing protein [Nitrospira sp. KM1]|uniref:DUF4435 domain-containing protein n=1 Tax=Nitrospira sp. KM1 TaxID=1936990 RepID=UPI0015652FA3|nr:DUF4435 domain-containing protein [Nitrospira sp. KM1]
MSYDRRTLEEIIARYELEPTLRDIYVEGEFDAFLIRWVLHEVGIRDSFVYEIATVEVPSSLLSDLGVDNNNRGRVVALAHRIAHHLGSQNRQVTLVIDKDFDSLLGKSHNTDLLLVTDYSSMEMYFFNQWHIQKFLTLVLQEGSLDVPILLSHITSILEYLFLLRFANYVRRLNLQWMSFERCCTYETGGSEIHFDQEDFITRYLNKNSASANKNDILQTIEEYKSRLSSDARLNAHGHDYYALMEWISKQLKPRCFNNTQSFERAFTGCLEVGRVKNEPLFQKLLQRQT